MWCVWSPQFKESNMVLYLPISFTPFPTSKSYKYSKFNREVAGFFGKTHNRVVMKALSRPDTERVVGNLVYSEPSVVRISYPLY